MIIQSTTGRLRRRTMTIRQPPARMAVVLPRDRDAAVPVPTRSSLRRLYAVLFAAAAFVIGVNILSVFGVRSSAEVVNRQLDLAHEANVVAWYSSSLLLLGGVTAAILAWLWSVAPAPFTWRRRLHIGGWLLIGMMLIGLAADEVAQVHEWLGNRVPHHVGAGETVLGLTRAFRWLIVLAPLIVGGAALLVWFACTCLRGGPRLLVIGGVGCWLGTIAAEYVESIQWRTGMPRGLQVPIEEGLEIIGTTLILIAFVEVLRRTLLTFCEERAPALVRGACGEPAPAPGG